VFKAFCLAWFGAICVHVFCIFVHTHTVLSTHTTKHTCRGSPPPPHTTPFMHTIQGYAECKEVIDASLGQLMAPSKGLAFYDCPLLNQSVCGATTGLGCYVFKFVLFCLCVDVFACLGLLGPACVCVCLSLCMCMWDEEKPPPHTLNQNKINTKPKLFQTAVQQPLSSTTPSLTLASSTPASPCSPTKL